MEDSIQFPARDFQHLRGMKIVRVTQNRNADEGFTLLLEGVIGTENIGMFKYNLIFSFGFSGNEGTIKLTNSDGFPMSPSCRLTPSILRNENYRACKLNCMMDGPPGPIWCSKCQHDPKCCNCEK